jgi:hypothetical protein
MWPTKFVNEDRTILAVLFGTYIKNKFRALRYYDPHSIEPRRRKSNKSPGVVKKQSHLDVFQACSASSSPRHSLLNISQQSLQLSTVVLLVPNALHSPDNNSLLMEQVCKGLEGIALAQIWQGHEGYARAWQLDWRCAHYAFTPST